MSVLPKLLSILVLLAVRAAVAAQNVPVGVQARVCGTDAALKGVYPFMPCTGDGVVMAGITYSITTVRTLSMRSCANTEISNH